MRLTLLGTGTPAPSATRSSAANLIDIGGRRLLVDAGRGVTTQLVRAGSHPCDIDYVFITHHHFDHMSGLDDLLLTAWTYGRMEPVHIYGPPGTVHIVDTLWREIYERDISFRLREAEVVGTFMPEIGDVFTVHDIAAGELVSHDGWTALAGAVEHGHALGLSHDEWPCLGFRIEAEGRSIVVSGDTIDCAGVRDLAQDADVLVQCCYLPEAAVDSAERRVLVNLVLASATQAAAIAAAASVKRMVLTHMAPDCDVMPEAVIEEASLGHDADVIFGEDLLEVEIA